MLCDYVCHDNFIYVLGDVLVDDVFNAWSISKTVTYAFLVERV
jgi:hypothetical protein